MDRLNAFLRKLLDFLAPSKPASNSASNPEPEVDPYPYTPKIFRDILAGKADHISYAPKSGYELPDLDAEWVTLRCQNENWMDDTPCAHVFDVRADVPIPQCPKCAWLYDYALGKFGPEMPIFRGHKLYGEEGIVAQINNWKASHS